MFLLAISLFLTTPAFAASSELLLPKYENWMKQHPSPVPARKTCVPPRPKAHPSTRRYRTAIGSEFREAGQLPNFCGKYFLMVTPITGGGEVFLFDCDSGAPFVYGRKYALTMPLIRLDSCAFVVNWPLADWTVDEFAHRNAQGHFPEPALGPPLLYVWDGKKVRPQKDPFWPGESQSGKD